MKTLHKKINYHCYMCEIARLDTVGFVDSHNVPLPFKDTSHVLVTTSKHSWVTFCKFCLEKMVKLLES